MVKCDICGKEFDNKSSLGGHKSSHNRTIRVARNTTKCLNCKRDIPYTRRKPKFCNINCKTEFNKIARDNRLIRVCGVQLNITIGEIEELKKTITKCQICGKSIEEIKAENNHFKSLCIDHNHTTNEFRGLLCLTCNSNLAWYETHRKSIENYIDNTLP